MSILLGKSRIALVGIRWFLRNYVSLSNKAMLLSHTACLLLKKKISNDLLPV